MLSGGGDTVTICTTFGPLATKRISPAGVEGYGNAKHYRVRQERVAGLGDFMRLLNRLLRCTTSFIIRGEPLPGVNLARCRRLLHVDPETGDPRNGDQWITDQDRIDLASMDANPSEGGDQAFAWVGHLAERPLGMGQVGYFVEGDDAVVAWIGGGGRQACVLDGLADQAGQLDAGDFWL